MTLPTRLSCAIVNHKPGTGKTTTAVHVSAALHVAGRRPLLMDADPGKSVLQWADDAGGFPWSVIGGQRRAIGQQIVTVTERGDWDAFIADCPQMEDHAEIVQPVLELCDVWVVPVAPAGIEVARMVAVVDYMNVADRHRDRPARRIGLLNRTNRLARSKAGPDAQCAEFMTELGFTVLDQQINFSDGRYRQCWGSVPDVDGTPYPIIANTLWEMQ